MTRTVAGAASSLKTEYLYRDHLESVDTITDETGAVVRRMSFDKFLLLMLLVEKPVPTFSKA